MSETKIFCSVIVFTLGVYTIVILQYELFKLNHLNNSTSTSTNHAKGSIHHHHDCPTKSFQKSKFNMNRLNCDKEECPCLYLGSAGDLLALSIENCTELPCDILPDANYTAALNFRPSRNMSTLEIQTFVRQKRDLKFSHKKILNVIAMEGMNTTLKFSFMFPSHHLLSSRKKASKCPTKVLFMVGVEIWDVPSGIGEICMIVPMTVSLNA